MEKVLVLNCGSSSIKFQVIEPQSSKVFFKGIAENLETDHAFLRFSSEGKEEARKLASSDYPHAIKAIIQLVQGEGMVAIGHRVVHGGASLRESVEITPYILRTIKECIHLAPLHNPVNVLGIEVMQAHFPLLPQVAVFDTAFHGSLPPHAYLYPLPYEYYEKYKIRRYGFHGINHRFVSIEAAKKLGIALKNSSLISVHLGNGCSVCAIKGGKSVDISMGFTPLEGLMMGQRSGDIDPGLIAFLVEKLQIDVNEVTTILNKKSGLLGISGISEDVRILLANQKNRRVQIAIELFCYRIAKYIASYIVPLGKVDGLIFTGGIGENAEPIRNKIVEYVAFLHLKVLVIPANEELAIARDTIHVIQGEQ